VGAAEGEKDTGMPVGVPVGEEEVDVADVTVGVLVVSVVVLRVGAAEDGAYVCVDCCVCLLVCMCVCVPMCDFVYI
jgi:hypothetical protein